MAFNSSDYFLFLPIAVILYYQIPNITFRRIFLLVCSYTFYGYFHRAYPILLFWVSSTAYMGGILFEKKQSERSLFRLFVFFLFLTLSVLVFFKYWNFILESVSYFFDILNVSLTTDSWISRYALPVGISFYTFQASGYLLDVYVGVGKAEKNPIKFYLFLSFFPQLVAGPIERMGNLLHQFDRQTTYHHGRTVEGLRMILLGLFMKIVVADSLAAYVQQVYSDPSSQGWDIVLGTVYFSFQVYGDFAGYSWIAIGSAKLFGISLMTNFTEPYLSQTIVEFWRNWHISLSSWLRDYLYTPLIFRYRHLGIYSPMIALTVTFIIAGIWHGAGMKFIYFGIMHGVLTVGGQMTITHRNTLLRKCKIPKNLITFTRVFNTFALICLTFIMFRANTVADASKMYQTLLSLDMGICHLLSFKVTFLIALVISIDLFSRSSLKINQFSKLMRYAIYNIVLFSILYHFGKTGEAPFIYFRF